jgi:copper chaperone CopZ
MARSEKRQTLGQAIYTEIEQNAYLNEIYNSLLFDNFLQVFHTKEPAKHIDIDDALRFADLLSKSNDENRADQQKSLAQEIVTLLNLQYPGNRDVQYVMGSVLTSTNNYLGLQHSVPGFKDIDLLDRLSAEAQKEYLSIPEEPNQYFLRSQKTVFDHICKDQYFSYAGPTSMGKSFVMRTFIKNRIQQEADSNFAILVPTKALINEVSDELAHEMGALLREKDYRIVTSAGATILQEKNKHHYIFVMTPERMMYQLIGFEDIPVNYLFVDEAQNISKRASRSMFYFQVIGMLNRSEMPPHIIFASPNIPNPDLYLELTSREEAVGKSEHFTSAFTPVSQEKFLIDMRNHQQGYYNGLSKELHLCNTFNSGKTFFNFIDDLGEGKKNLIYCNSKTKVTGFAKEYAARRPKRSDKDLEELAREIREQVHDEYFLADTVERGVAYHVGYLPTNIRLKIEELFRKRDGGISTIFCTSTLLEGVNLPADNLFVTDFRNGRSPMSSVEFRNLIGRVGRIQYALYGNVFFVCLPNGDVEPENFTDLLKKEAEPQILSIDSLTKAEKKYIVDCLRNGITKLEKLKGQTEEQFSFMRKSANILVRDILLVRKGRVRREFNEILTPRIELEIKEAFSGRKNEPDDDINLSVDQVDKLVEAIEGGLEYPTINFNTGYVSFNEILDFLEKLCKIYNWENYEKSTLGAVNQKGEHRRLRYYSMLLKHWFEGKGIKYMIDQSIDQYQSKGKKVYIDGTKEPYDGSVRHRNVIIEETLNDINDIILFRLSNYFMRFSTELKKHKGKPFLTNDWYEFVEYGTTNKTSIWLQKNGFTSETASYILQDEHLYVFKTEDGLRINISILNCKRDSVKEEAKQIYSNIPEIFAEG